MALVKRMWFRFGFTLVLALWFPFPLWFVPVVGTWIGTTWNTGLKAVVAWVGGDLLGIENLPALGRNGSGDTTADYLFLAIAIVFAILVAIGWSIALRGRDRDHQRLAQLLRVYVRYAIGFTAIGYGLVKVLPTQFGGDVRPTRLLQPLGDSSPMGLLWTFMAASKPYTIFGGLAEVLGGLLLLWRRTTLLGGLILIAVFVNVVMLNFSYDVPVKLFSSQILLLTIYLVWRDLPRLLAFLLRHQAVAPVSDAPFSSRRWVRAVKVVAIAWILFQEVSEDWTAFRTRGAGAEVDPIVDVWDVEQPSSWQRVAISQRRILARNKDDRDIDVYAETNFAFPTPGAGSTVELTDSADDTTKHAFTITTPAPDVLRLQCTELAFDVRLRRSTHHRLLVDRGFHWINEFPFNR